MAQGITRRDERQEMERQIVEERRKIKRDEDGEMERGKMKA